jgi:Tol biopolymer transport system component
MAFYENHGFSKDGSKILFSGSHEARWPTDNNLYVKDLKTGSITKLSGVNYNDRNYDEHAQYTPDGSKIIWGTNRNNNNKGLDYWIMNADGTNQKRLTYFNHQTISKHVPKKTTYTASDFSFHPSGRKIVAWIFTDLKAQEGFTAIIEFK